MSTAHRIDVHQHVVPPFWAAALSAPGMTGWDNSGRREMARRVNEYTAGLVAKRPDRFGHFATLPLPDVDGALQELEHALDTLRADGVILLANYSGKYLGEAAFEPVWAELHRRQAVVYVHPGQPPVRTAAGPPRARRASPLGT